MASVPAAAVYVACRSPVHACRALTENASLPVCRLQPYLKFHNPRTFEDMDKPIPNFKKFDLKAGGQAAGRLISVGAQAAFKLAARRSAQF